MIAENLHIIKERIAERCLASGRKPEDIRLIAVSKNTGLELINEAVGLGLCDLGENKAQELNEKAQLLKDEKITWHFLGHLQSNKVKYAVENVEFIHSIDSVKIADEVNRQAQKRDKIQKILIEVKTSDEPAKYGINNFDNLLELASFCREAENLELTGLMTMAPFVDDENIIRKSFSGLRKYKELLNEKGFNLSELSMGMTGDYEIAIEEGATMLRIGTAIFGERDYSKSWKEQ
jgi:pyridoxal phosphate enzyme (YggS family)